MFIQEYTTLINRIKSIVLKISSKMKKVAYKEFFSVMWSGICQSIRWFFGLFGYKRDGMFAKCVWGMFSVSAAIILAIIAYSKIYSFYEKRKSQERENYCNCQFVSSFIGYIENPDERNGFLINKETGKKVLKGISWISYPHDEDTLFCFCNGSLRGYFNMNDGKVAIEPKYNRAWAFSDGVAAVEQDGRIVFIDGKDQVVIDGNIKYNPSANDYYFQGGYLVVSNEDNGKFGLMDKSGKLVLDKEYDNIFPAYSLDFWCVRKENQSAVYDKDMNVILPFIDGVVYMTEKSIDVTMHDHTMRKYDYLGNLIDDFCISNVAILEYETDEIMYYSATEDEDGNTYNIPIMNSYHPKATARLRAYTAGDEYKGLMTADGHIVTMPLYENIKAIGLDTYLCVVSNGEKVIVDGKGFVVNNGCS